MSAGLSVVTFAFTGYTPKHRCAITQCGENGLLENATYEFHNPDVFNITEDMKTYIYKSCQRMKPRTEKQGYRNRYKLIEIQKMVSDFCQLTKPFLEFNSITTQVVVYKFH